MYTDIKDSHKDITNNDNNNNETGKSIKDTIRVYCDGIYDLFHSGHSNQFKQVHQHKNLKNFKVFLIVGGK